LLLLNLSRQRTIIPQNFNYLVNFALKFHDVGGKLAFVAQNWEVRERIPLGDFPDFCGDRRLQFINRLRLL